MSTLLDIRKQFITLSGRYDLASGGIGVWDTDEGADYFINAGLRWLDLRQEHLQTPKVWVVSVAAGTAQLTLKGVRAIREVWFQDATGDPDFIELDKRDLEYILLNYPDLASTTQGTPLDWAPGILHTAPESPVTTGAAQPNEAVINIMPPPDQAYIAQIFGDFISLPLVNNTDVNYWTVNHEDILVNAALRALEIPYRNTQGVNDFTTAIDDALIGIDRDLVNAAMPENENMAMRG